MNSRIKNECWKAFYLKFRTIKAMVNLSFSIIQKGQLLARHLTYKKLQNLWALHSSFYYSRKMKYSFHRGMPAKIGFEPTTHCNLRCPQCPSGLRNFTRPTGLASDKLYEAVVDELAPHLIYLLLYFQGEPFLNPRLFDMIAYANERHIFTATSTNGHFLTEKNAVQTVKSGLSEIIISVDGTTQEVYEQYRKGGKLERVWDGIKNLVKARKKYSFSTPYIIIQFIVFKPNQHQVHQIKEIGNQLGVDHVAIKTAQIYDYQNGHELIPTINKYSRYKKGEGQTYTIKNRMENQCWRLWQGAEITWDGKVLPCCFDKDAKYEMGNLAAQSFREIWHGESYHQFRNALLTSRSQIDICQNCSEGTRIWE